MYVLAPAIMCDLCGRRHETAYEHKPSGDGKTRTNAPDARKSAKQAGWQVGLSGVVAKEAGAIVDRSGKFDLCEKCRK